MSHHLDSLANRQAMRQKHFDTFQRTFGQSLSKFWHPLTGFDIIKFDETVVKPGDDEAMSQAVVRQWGEPAADLIRDLLG
jgi:hypothetical protein